MQEIGIDRIMFAVDWPFVANPLGTEWVDTIPLCDEDKIKILVRQRQAAAAHVSDARRRGLRAERLAGRPRIVPVRRWRGEAGAGSARGRRLRRDGPRPWFGGFRDFDLGWTLARGDLRFRFRQRGEAWQGKRRGFLLHCRRRAGDKLGRLRLRSGFDDGRCGRDDDGGGRILGGLWWRRSFDIRRYFRRTVSCATAGCSTGSVTAGAAGSVAIAGAAVSATAAGGTGSGASGAIAAVDGSLAGDAGGSIVGVFCSTTAASMPGSAGATAPGSLCPGSSETGVVT